MVDSFDSKLCKAYAQLGARGVSILFASGDSGVGCQNSNATLFQPTFPSNCPWVTSVGGTVGLTSKSEAAWDGSSGGFSNYYPAPSYQASAVNHFLTAHAASSNFNATKGKYNPVGRGFPDVAAKADNYRIWEGTVASIYGTSASTPVFASIVALINDRLSVQGKPPMGFLNPWLYSTGKSALTDIKSGNNSIECNGETAGFEAIEGWDPVRLLRFRSLLSVCMLTVGGRLPVSAHPTSTSSSRPSGSERSEHSSHRARASLSDHLATFPPILTSDFSLTNSLRFACGLYCFRLLYVLLRFLRKHGLCP